MLLKIKIQKLFFIAAIFCFILLGLAYFLEYRMHLNPCPLCLLQRYVLWAMAILFILAGWTRTLFFRLFYVFALIGLGIIGILLSGRQIWLEHLPSDKLPSCTAGLERLLEIYPWFEVLKMSFSSGECGKEAFYILGLSLASWSLLSFLVLLGILCVILIRSRSEVI